GRADGKNSFSFDGAPKDSFFFRRGAGVGEGAAGPGNITSIFFLRKKWQSLLFKVDFGQHPLGRIILAPDLVDDVLHKSRTSLIGEQIGPSDLYTLQWARGKPDQNVMS